MPNDQIEFLDEGTVTAVATTESDTDSIELQISPTVVVLAAPSLDTLELFETGPGMGGGSGDSGHYVHTQSVASATWTVTHNLSSVRQPAVVLDSEPDAILICDVSVINLNTISIQFDSPVTGKAYL